jgi:glutamate dehydrogenase (NAD(P)+)
MTRSRWPWAHDALGPELVLVVRLPAGCEGIVVVDDTTLGPAIGGVRLGSEVTPDEVARLARAMTLKNAAAGLPHGGGKAGIRTAGPLDEATKESVIRAFAHAIRHLEEYVPGPDMGTDETSMAWIRDEIGRAVGLPAVLGGIPLDEIGATGYGLAVCADALVEAGRLTLRGARAAVQGFGAVGRPVARLLAERGALVVAVADRSGTVHDPDGLDVVALAEFNRHHPLAEYHDAKVLEPGDVLTVDCDLLVPAAQPDVLHGGNVDQVKARVIVPGANIPATAPAEAELRRRGVLMVPDFIANAGGVICGSVEYHGGGREQAFAAIRTRISANVAELLERMDAAGEDPRTAAEAMARRRLAGARAYRRRF